MNTVHEGNVKLQKCSTCAINATPPCCPNLLGHSLERTYGLEPEKPLLAAPSEEDAQANSRATAPTEPPSVDYGVLVLTTSRYS